MANPYPAQVVDTNGEIRVDGKVTFTDGGNQPGGFNGGTITTGLQVRAQAGVDAVKAYGNAADPSSQAVLEVRDDPSDDTAVFGVDRAGYVFLNRNIDAAEPMLQVSTFAKSSVFVIDQKGGVFINPEATTWPLVILPSSTDFPALMIDGATAAPLDSNIDTGGFAFWLDATPGATKLMVKAKDSGGTVRTAAIALS